MSKKIVVLTGSFNPITKAHRLILENAINKVNADLGLLVIVSDAYLNNKIICKRKDKRPFIISEDVRKQLIDSLNNEFPNIKYGGVELGGASPSTVKTLKKIQRKYKDYELYFSIGADKLKGFSHWNDIESFFSKINLIVYPREGFNIEETINNDTLLTKIKDKIIVLDCIKGANGISSTKLRECFFKNLDYKDLMDNGPYEIFKKLNPSDYKEISAEQIIKAHIIYGGRFGGNAARKEVYKENTKLFKNWDNSLLGDRNDKILNTKVYKHEFKISHKNHYETIYECENIDCSGLALRLINEGLNPVILNIASNKRPCGGYNDGVNAQEESLCQMSTLSQSLYQFANPKFKYFKDANVAHIPDVYPMDINFGGIYSPNVCFFRNNLSEHYSLKEKTFDCSIVTVASLSNRETNDYTNNESMYFDNNGYLTSEGKEIEKNKIRTIYRIALDNNHDSIVLGAFGCGVYRLHPEEVSKLFKEIVEEDEFKNAFKVVAFAIYEGKGSKRKIVGRNGKFKPFYDIFNNQI